MTNKKSKCIECVKFCVKIIGLVCQAKETMCVKVKSNAVFFVHLYIYVTFLHNFQFDSGAYNLEI